MAFPAGFVFRPLPCGAGAPDVDKVVLLSEAGTPLALALRAIRPRAGFLRPDAYPVMNHGPGRVLRVRPRIPEFNNGTPQHATTDNQ